jgi:hypothetical protein
MKVAICGTIATAGPMRVRPAVNSTTHAAFRQLNADFGLDLAGLPTERRLGRVQPLLGCRREVRPRRRRKISTMPTLHAADPCLAGMPATYKVFLRRARTT